MSRDRDILTNGCAPSSKSCFITKHYLILRLPVEIDGVDRAFTASATVSTSKKDAQVQCALEACRILDTYNVLRFRRMNMAILSRLIQKVQHKTAYATENS